MTTGGSMTKAELVEEVSRASDLTKKHSEVIVDTVFRSIIEASAVAVYAETADETEMEETERRHMRAVEAIASEGLTPQLRDELEALEELLHFSIVGTLGNPLIDTSYRRIHNYLRILRLDRKITEPLALRSLREHLGIIEACRRRSAVDAQAALQGHFANAMQRNMGLY